MALAPGSRLGPYEILSSLGAGGMEEVYRARDPRLGRDVAIKVLAEPPHSDPSFSKNDRLQLFEQEARAVAALSHPNVLAIFDIGVGDPPFLVTELLEGETLRALLEHGPLSLDPTIDLALQMVAGLSAAHARGIVHRDLKPENIFVTADGRVKILDFGLARRAAGAGDDGNSVTRLETTGGTVAGTVGYMAPEQLRGLAVDQRADIFALGAVLFEMTTGRRAFRGESPADTISAVLTTPASTLSFPATTPPALVKIIQRCLEKDPLERFQGVREVGSGIELISDVRVAAAAPPMSASAASSIAVLPFVNLSADPENQYFSDGLTEDLINALARLSGLRVASRTSSFRFRGCDADIRQIGRDLGVDAILEGSVRRAGDRLRITAQLTSADNGYHIWSDRYDRAMATYSRSRTKSSRRSSARSRQRSWGMPARSSGARRRTCRPTSCT